MENCKHEGYLWDNYQCKCSDCGLTWDASICKHCGGDLRKMNPMGNCQHYQYPDACKVCTQMKQDTCEHSFECSQCHKPYGV